MALRTSRVAASRWARVARRPPTCRAVAGGSRRGFEGNGNMCDLVGVGSALLFVHDGDVELGDATRRLPVGSARYGRLRVGGCHGRELAFHLRVRGEFR